MDKYLITGYAGFVGYHFINLLNSFESQRIEVLGLDITKPIDFDNWKFENIKIEHKTIDLLNSSEVENVITDFKPTHILHLAALSSVGMSWKQPASCFLNNTGIFLNLIESVRKIGLETKILCIGSSEEYGLITNDLLPLEEKIVIKPANPYAVTKMAQENLAQIYCTGFGMDIICTRSFNHIGPRQRDVFVVASFTKQVAQASFEGKKKMIMTTGNLNIIRDFLDVRDVVNAYFLLLHNGKSGDIYNICSGKGTSLYDIIEELSIISGIEIETNIDASLIRPNDIPKIIGSNEKIKNNIGWKPNYSLHQTLTDTYNYWKKDVLNSNNIKYN